MADKLGTLNILEFDGVELGSVGSTVWSAPLPKSSFLPGDRESLAREASMYMFWWCHGSRVGADELSLPAWQTVPAC